jgi:hypothetical protein
VLHCAEENFRSETYEFVLRFVLQTDPEQLPRKRGWTTNCSVLKELAEREGFEPSIQVLARITV